MGNLFRPFQKKTRSSQFSHLDEVEQFIKASMISVSTGTKCVDGRYLPSQAHGMLARPGADCGYVMALEAVNRNKNLGLTPEQCFNAVFKAVTKLNGTFYLHTDEHTDPNPHTHNGLIGCGHLAKAGRKFLSWEYDIRSNDVREIVQYARNLCEVSPQIEMINLRGQHEEKGVLLVHSATYTVLADNPKRHQMYFIYDVDRDRAFMKQLVETMKISGVTIRDMIRESDLQLDATLQNLAVGLPIFDVTFKGDKPQVTYVKQVEHKPLFARMHLPFSSPFHFALRK
jgi:hypothetical protein